MRRGLTIVPILLLALIAPQGANAFFEVPGCASGTPGSAAAELIHPGAEVAELGRVGGFPSALILEPLVYPGVRHRLVQAGPYWCDASGFNAAWRIAGRASDAVEMASSYSQIVAAPYFDGVSVRSARQVAPGVVSVSTHALTNGITARWTVLTDASGVSHATWTSTGLGVDPFEAEIEGISASPGLQRSYTRNLDGSLHALQPILPQMEAAPETVTQATLPDGFTIKLSYSNSNLSPNAGQDTTVDVVDRPRIIMKMLTDNYNDFLAFGLKKGWTSDTGTVYFDSDTGVSCFACVYIREQFQIHMFTGVLQVLAALGFEYPDDKKALSNVLGHEMFHNFQNASYKPDQNGASTSTAFSEGTARFQETLHTYSDVSHQPNSLIYSIGREAGGLVSLAANSCNGWNTANVDNDFAAGPFTSKSYNACYFWLSWYQQHGTSGIADLFAASVDHAKKSGHQEVIDTLQQATGGTFADDLAAFAQASITGKGYAWAPPGKTAPVLDWGQGLDRWTPATLSGGSVSKTIGNGGVMAREVLSGGTVSSSSAANVSLYVIRDNGTTASRTLIDRFDGVADVVAAPAAGERVWLIAVNPNLGNSGGNIQFTPAA
jgi:hypothetical protein